MPRRAEVEEARGAPRDVRRTPRLCDRCHERSAQSRLGICRRCQRELGDTRTLFEREAESVARQHARFKGGKIPLEDLVPRPDKILTIAGVDYYVVWDGA